MTHEEQRISESYSTMVPHRAMDELDIFEFRVYVHHLRLYSGAFIPFRESIREIARACKMSTGMTHKCVRALVEKRYIPEHPTRSDKGPGWVYVIVAANGLHKIGLTTDPVNVRLAGLRTMSPIELTLRFVVATETPRRLEAQLHQRFANKRTHGEWFNLTDQDIADLRKEYVDG